MEGRMECWFDLERHLDAEIIGLQVAKYNWSRLKKNCYKFPDRKDP